MLGPLLFWCRVVTREQEMLLLNQVVPLANPVPVALNFTLPLNPRPARCAVCLPIGLSLTLPDAIALCPFSTLPTFAVSIINNEFEVNLSTRRCCSLALTIRYLSHLRLPSGLLPPSPHSSCRIDAGPFLEQDSRHRF
jgi:hypothetical protein